MPERSHDQRLEALEKANSIRSARRGARETWGKLPLRQAVEGLIELLERPTSWAGSWRVEAALMALPRIGHERARKAMLVVGFDRSRTIGGLTDRQREELILWLRDRGGG